MTRIKIEVTDVYCADTEDITGADDFYLVGALVGGSEIKGILTCPIKINEKQTKTFPSGDCVLFDGEVPSGQAIKGGLKALDEDYAKDWSRYQDTIRQITQEVSSALAGAGSNAVSAGLILSVSTRGIGILQGYDRDDLLGATELEITTTGPSYEEKIWRMSKKSSMGWSTWDYTVRYRITRSESPINNEQPSQTSSSNSPVVEPPAPEKPPINSPVVEPSAPEKPPINSQIVEQPVPEKPPINSPVIEPPAPEEVAVNPVVDRLVLKELYDMRLPAEHIARCLESELGSNARALVETSLKQLAENGLVETVDLDYPETLWTATPKGEDYKGDSTLSIKEEILGEKQSQADKAVLRALSHSGMHNLDLDFLMSSTDNIDRYSNRYPDRYSDRYRDMERYRPPMRGGRLTMESLLREVHEYELGVYSDHQKIPAIQASLQRLKDNGMIEKTEFRGWEITDKGRDFMYS
ncbi:hypothetical protein NG799_27135 [Laspinema sp. D1]|uniref:Uncharacterized protein n=1 Tax=Laspinema palackyanum D2a TaxID=2953684 RepID=A0ABT2MZ97_9CYAN|nr:hypothetical protein [Laspinema sp. D2a]